MGSVLQSLSSTNLMAVAAHVKQCHCYQLQQCRAKNKAEGIQKTNNTSATTTCTNSCIVEEPSKQPRKPLVLQYINSPMHSITITQSSLEQCQKPVCHKQLHIHQCILIHIEFTRASPNNKAHAHTQTIDTNRKPEWKGHLGHTSTLRGPMFIQLNSHCCCTVATSVDRSTQLPNKAEERFQSKLTSKLAIQEHTHTKPI